MQILGKSDLQVSRLSFGCMSLSDNTKSNQAVLRHAAEHGINYFDTADLYHDGRNEMLVGEALAPVRKNVLIATKVGNQRMGDGTIRWNPRKNYILKSVEQSLTRLRTDYIDLYQLHGGTIDDPIDETIEAFELLKEQGKIRWYGISSIRPNVIRAYVKRSNIVSVMMQYSLLDRRPEEEMLDLLQQHDIAVIARGAIARGLLVDKEPETYLQYTESEVAKAAKAITTLANKSGSNVMSVALSYVLSHPSVTTAALGIRTASQLDDVLTVLGDIQQLNQDELATLQIAVRKFCYQDHR